MHDPAMGVVGKVIGRSPAWLNGACATGILVCSAFWESRAQTAQAPTFQYKEAKTPAESIDSIKLLERALELTQTALGPDDRAVAELAYRLAQRYDDAGDYDKALHFYERSLAIQEKEFGPEDRGVADCLNDLGCLQQELQNYDEALRLFQKSLTITEKVYGPDHFEVANTLSNIADTDVEKSDYLAALRAGKRALQIREKALGAGHPDVADSLCTLADAYRGMGDTTQATRAAERALAIAEKSLGSAHPLVADCLSSLADIQKDCGKLDQAIRLEKRALAINERISGQEHPDVFRNLSALAQIELLAGNLPEAVSTLGDLAARQRRYLARHFQTSSWKVASRVADVFRESSDILQTICAAAPAGWTNWMAADAAENSALSKGFWEEVQAAHAALEASQQTRVTELHAEFQKVESQLTRLPESESDAEKRDVKRLELEFQLSTITTELARRVGVVAQRIMEEKTSLTAIARELPPGTALLDFVQYRRYDFTAKTNQWKEQHYAAYVTFPLARDSTNLLIQRVDLGQVRPIDDAVQVICQRMSAGQYAAQDLSEGLQRVSQLIWGPLSKHLTNSSRLIICPDGQLSRLPFEMLPSLCSSNESYLQSGRYLIEEKTISYVGSGREIFRFTSSDPRRPSPLVGRSKDSKGDAALPATISSFVMGDPDFDFDLESVHERDGILQVSAGTSPLRSLTRDYHGMRFGRLPGAEAEARSIAKLLGDRTILKLGRDAREAELKAAVSPQVLLLATHGFFFSDQELRRTNGPLDAFLARGAARQRSFGEDSENPLMRCGIALAGANRAFTRTNSAAEDGLFTGLEASMLDLQGTELVILSACDSGNGEVRIGEGVMSLRRAFRIAGAQTVLASHWEVSDRATEELMTKFIELWRSGKPRADAWREAQLSLVHSKDLSSPYFWAAFTLTGQWN